VSALWAQVFELPQCARMMGLREATIRVFLAKLARVLTEPAHGTGVLAFDRDQIARLEAIADAHAPIRLGPRRSLARSPGAAFDPGPRRHGAVLVGPNLDRGRRFGVKWHGNHSRNPWILRPTERIDIADPALEIDGLLDVADVDDFGEWNEEVGLAAIDHTHIAFG